jgi:hypothetical protein
MAISYAPPFGGTCDTCGKRTLVDCHMCGSCATKANRPPRPAVPTHAKCGNCGNTVRVERVQREYGDAIVYAEHRSGFGSGWRRMRRCTDSGVLVHPSNYRATPLR